MSSVTQRDVATVALLLLALLVFLPVLGMGLWAGGMMGFGGMMGPVGGAGWWWPFVGVAVPLTLFLLFVVAGVLLLRRGTEGSAADSALEELRLAYARGDLTDEEYETRRERLERER